MLRNLLCWLMIALVPMSLMGSETSAALLEVQGTAWLNGAAPARTQAVFPGDWLQTQEHSVASLHASGSNVTVQAETLVQFKPEEVTVQHGGVTVATMKGMSVQAGEVRVTPVLPSVWTQYQVTSEDGTVQVLAQKGDVQINDCEGTTTVLQGQQATRKDSEKRKKCKKSTYVPYGGQAGLLSTKAAMWAGIAAGGAVTGWVLTRHDDPLSSHVP